MRKKWKILLTITIIFTWFISYLIYDIWNYKSRLYWISKIEKKINNRYVIWTRWKDRKICDNFLKYWCLEWNIISYKIENDNIYIYYKPYGWTLSAWSFEEWAQSYSIFWPYDNFLLIDDFPNLIKIDTYLGVRWFYNSNHIDKLSDKDKKIFKELINIKSNK